uniref:Uncharacterized protein n=1 Tax=Mus musculus TaxID=10090 RepID=Q8BNQ7_MOUSE|nr:unnamed protein product [Mus musculus]
MEAQPPGLGSGREALGQGSPNPVLLSSAPVCALTCPSTLGGPFFFSRGCDAHTRASSWTAWEGTPAARGDSVPTPRPARLPFCSATAILRGPGAGEGLGARPRGSRWAWPKAGRGPGPLCSPPGGREAPRALQPPPAPQQQQRVNRERQPQGVRDPGAHRKRGVSPRARDDILRGET